MRTKIALGLAALAASAVTVVAADNVYSLNVVGYVNKEYKLGKFTIASNPLKNGGNTLKEIIPNPPDGTLVFRWIAANQDLDLVTIPSYSVALSTWVPNSVIDPGEAFFVVANGDFTNTYVGEVMQGANLSIPLTGDGNFDAIASIPPLGGALKNNVLGGYAGTDGDLVFVWLNNAEDFDLVNIPSYSLALDSWTPEANIPVGDGFFLVRAGGPATYTRSFTVP